MALWPCAGQEHREWLLVNVWLQHFVQETFSGDSTRQILALALVSEILSEDKHGGELQNTCPEAR